MSDKSEVMSSPESRKRLMINARRANVATAARRCRLPMENILQDAMEDVKTANDLAHG